ncbi:MAG: hypothetical protein H6737_29785 [Alphaproteobacteria bacterium]|nr:hypothetical protein [Alphaproteobacteria bacterium]
MLVLLAMGCGPAPAVLIDEHVDQPGFGWVDEVPTGTDPDDPEPEDWSIYEGAEFRIVSPASGSFRALGELRPFEAQLIAADGTALWVDQVTWSSSVDPTWDGIGMYFEDDSIDVGLHDITAEVTLPNGDRLAHTVGGVRVQHPLAGTFSGLFSATGGYQQFQFSCSGSSLLQVDAYGEYAQGTGDCVASLILFDLPLNFLFDLEVDPATGEMTGQAGAQIIGPLVYDFPATGFMQPTQIDLTWAGTVLLLNFDVTADLTAERISRDPLE